MAKVSLVKGTTSYLARIFIQDSSSTTGAGLTGLTSGSANLVCYRARDDDGNAGGTAITLSAGTRGTWSSGGFVEKDATNMPGVYEFGVPNAALATGSKSCLIMFKGATNMAPLPLEIELTGTDNQDAVHGGMSALPNTAVTTNASLLTSGTGTDQLHVVSGVADANVKQWSGTNVASTITAGVPVVDWTPSPAELTGTATASAAGSITLAAAASTTANFYSGMTILITSGTGKGQARLISGYTTGRIASVTPAWTTTPASTATYIIFPIGPSEIEGLLFGNSSSGAAVTNATAGILDVNTKNYNNQAAQTDANNLPKVDTEDWKGTAVSAPATAGIPDINVKNIVNTAAAVDGNNLLKVDVVDWAGSVANALVSGRVDASIGANNAGNLTANVIQWNSTNVATPNTAGVPIVDTREFTRVNTAQAGAAGTITLDSGASATDNLYNRQEVTIISGTGVGQSSRVITGYVGSTKVATITPNWTTNPDSTSVFALKGVAADIETILNVASFGQAGYVGIDWGHVVNPTTTVVLANTTMGTLTTYTGNTPQTGDVYGALTGSTTEPTSPPTATDSILNKIKWLFCLGKNKRTQTSSTETVRNDGDTGNISTSAKSDDGTTFTRGKYV
jgi:hypothetical protein